MTRNLLAVLAVAALVAAPAAASAQIHTGVSLAAGIALPQGDGSDQSNSGYNLAAGLNIGVPLLPVGVRVEGGYNGFKDKVGSGNTNIVSGTANATFGLGLPYVIGGLGYYSAKSTGESSRTNGFGYNGGVGIRFPLGVISTFAEARYHKLTGDLSGGYIPITFGINF